MLLQQRRVRGVVKRAQHAGNVLQRRALLAAILKRASRLPFEIDNDEITAGEEDLSEMIVAVDAGNHSRTAQPGEPLEAAAGNSFKLEDPACVVLSLVRQFILKAAEQGEVGGQKLDRGVGECLSIGRGKRLRREFGIFRNRGQRQMQLSRPAAQ